METTAVIYRIILLGHIVSAIVGFGALITHGTFHARAVRSRPPDAMPILDATARGARLAEYGFYGVLGFGIVLVALSDDVYRYGAPWVSAAFVIWMVIVGLVHGLIRPARSRLIEVATSADGEADLAEHADAQPLLARLAIGEATTQLLLVGALILMIWKPGQ